MQSEADGLADNDDGGAARLHLAADDEDLRDDAALAVGLLCADVLLGQAVGLDPAEGAVQVGDELLGADDPDRLARAGGVGGRTYMSAIALLSVMA
jgi:hypothetical protein